MWAAICESFIGEMLHLTNPQKYSIAKDSDYLKGEVAKSLTMPTCPAHKPFGLQFLAKTLI